MTFAEHLLGRSSIEPEELEVQEGDERGGGCARLVGSALQHG